VAAVCILPFHVPLASSIVSGTRVRVAAALAFPGGGSLPEAKAADARGAVAEGASELDIPINLGAARAGAWHVVRSEVEAVRAAAPGALSKWIVETSALSEAEVRIAVQCVGEGGGDFVKTSTGYGPAGATADAVRLLRKLAGPMGVKASGGIRTRAAALELIEAGADRIGTSAARTVLA
jgi:deoxyribose-phosphate aldolase